MSGGIALAAGAVWLATGASGAGDSGICVAAGAAAAATPQSALGVLAAA